MKALNRREVVASLLKRRDGLLVVAGLGAPAWDCAAAGDHPFTFPLWGAMGSAAMIGLGLALAQPKRRVLVVTGDGEMLMGLGSLATIGVRRPGNLSIVVLDNERYGVRSGSSGGRPRVWVCRLPRDPQERRNCGRALGHLPGQRSTFLSGEGQVRQPAARAAAARRRPSQASFPRRVAREGGRSAVTAAGPLSLFHRARGKRLFERDRPRSQPLLVRVARGGFEHLAVGFDAVLHELHAQRLFRFSG